MRHHGTDRSRGQWVIRQHHFQPAGAQVVDSFYVKDSFGFKLSKSKKEALDKRLREAITRGAERAATA